MITDVNDLTIYVHEMNKLRNDQQKLLDKIPNDLIQEVRNLEENEDDRSPKIQKVKEILENEFFCKTITGFTQEELTYLVEKSEGFFEMKGRGRKYHVTQIDLIVIFLHYLRRYPRFEEGSCLFGINKSTYEKYIESATDQALNCWYNQFVIYHGEHIFPPVNEDFNVSYIVDATVQPINIPIGSFDDKKEFFSGKHSIYCYKSQVICDVRGLAVDIVSGIPGSVHDMKVFADNYKKFKERILDVHLLGGDKIMADKGYVSIEYEDKVLTPKKGNPMNLSQQENERNAAIASVRITIENYFGRLKNKFEIMSCKYRSERPKYEAFFKICCSLVNFDIQQCGNFLTAEDGEYYIRLMSQQIYLEKIRINKIKEENKKRLNELKLRFKRVRSSKE